MKQNFKHPGSYIMGIALLVTMTLSQCGLMTKNCCGYNGPIVSTQAIALYAKDHFIPKAMIDEWTERYNNNKGFIKKDSLLYGLGDPCSFNGPYVRLLLCNKKCIGIRVLYGMDPQYKVHVILVGIKPDYSNLYIPKPGYSFAAPKEINPIRGVNSLDEAPADFGGHEYGGLEFSQKP